MRKPMKISVYLDGKLVDITEISVLAEKLNTSRVTVLTHVRNGEKLKGLMLVPDRPLQRKCEYTVIDTCTNEQWDWMKRSDLADELEISEKYLYERSRNGGLVQNRYKVIKRAKAYD